VYATDISKEALLVARENALQHSVTINFAEDSILAPSLSSPDGFDIIISNPPYIPYSELKSLPVNVSEHEPHSALFVLDKNPILFYEAICNFAVRELKNNGSLYFEINPDYADTIADYLKKNGFKDVIFRNDLSGHLRFIKATHLIDK